MAVISRNCPHSGSQAGLTQDLFLLITFSEDFFFLLLPRWISQSEIVGSLD